MINPQSKPSSHMFETSSKVAVLGTVICLCMLALVARLFWLQVLQNKYYRDKAVDNSTRVTFLRAPRGVIYDRHGNLLATNKQSLSMVAIPNQIEHVSDLAFRLSRVLDLPVQKINALLLKAKASNSVLPYVIERDVDMKVVSNFYENRMFLPGIDILADVSRSYPQGELCAHVLGYCGEITSTQLETRPERRMGDVIGQDGVERLYDVQLRGVDGEQRVAVNAMGTSLSKETAKPVIRVRSLQLIRRLVKFWQWFPDQVLILTFSLDVSLQRSGKRSMRQLILCITVHCPVSHLVRFGKRSL
jgi:penicillin-binding protein 2